MLVWLLSLAALAQAHAAPPEQAGVVAVAPTSTQAPVVVELFTSQGCPMCPSANQFLAEYDVQNNVIALGWGVNYWDAYGWVDEYARPEFVKRQKAYVNAGEVRRVYTPHFVINGAPERLRFDPERINATIDATKPVALAVVEIVGDGMITRLSGPERAGPADIWAAYYRPGVEIRTIESGRNAGLEMSHFNMVRSIVKLGEWSGGDAVFDVPATPEGLAGAILIQDGPGGPILAANRLPPGH